MTDHTGRRVLEVVPAHATEAAVRLWGCLPLAQRAWFVAVSMDMGANFAAATRQAAPQAKIVHDRCHVSEHLKAAVDRVRREEHRRLSAVGDESLKGTKYQWLRGTLSGESQAALDFEDLRAQNLRTARACSHKETFDEFCAQPTVATARNFHAQWHRLFMRSRHEPLKKVARMLKAHLDGLLNYFVHAITNARTEGFNSRIQAIKANARDFRRFGNFRTRFLFFCGKLDLAPLLPFSPLLAANLPTTKVEEPTLDYF